MPTSSEINPPIPPAPPGEAPLAIENPATPEASAPNTLESSPPAPSEAKTPPAPAEPSSVLTPSAFDFDADDEKLTSPAEIDARRARHSLDRARQHAERGEMAAAILACRQAIALSPQLADAHGLLGSYLEMNGDRAGAILAYEKAQSLSPEALDAESKARLDELKAEPAGINSYSFDETELFGASTAKMALPIDARLPPVTEEAEQKKAIDAAVPLMGVAASETAPPEESLETLYDFSPLPETGTTKPSGEPNFLFPAIEAKPANPAPSASAATFASGRPSYDLTTGAATPRMAATPPQASSPVNFQFDPDTKSSAPAWSQYLRGPSLYARTLPIAVVAILGLGLMVWARGRSASQATDVPPVTVSDPAQVVSTDPNQPPQQAAPVQPVTGTNNPNQQGFTISNQRTTGAAPAPATTTSNAAAPAPQGATNNAAPPRVAANTGARPASGATRPSTGTPPRFPSANIVPPAAIPLNGSRNAGSGNSGNGNRSSNIILPRPDVASPAPVDPPARVLPPDNTNPNVGVGGNGLNPSGSPDRGYIRVRNARVGTSLLPERPDTGGRSDEAAANEAARGGETDAAINRLSAAITSNPNDGYRYQQRAGLFMQSGDYGRAADDFQAAISAYQNQIDRGENVTAARAGLRSARSGLNVALSRR